MRNRYYEAGENRAARVNDLFGTIAHRYDLINDLQSFGLHRVWKRRLVKLASPQPGQRALDVCCGTGDVAFALARCGLEVVGLDFSGPMLAVAQQRLENAKAHRLAAKAAGSGEPPVFLRGDAQQIPFPDAAFDVVTISYGLRNLADWEGGLAEMLRVTRPSGRLLVLDFGKPEQPAWRACYFAYLRLGIPLFGRIFCGDSQTHSYILASLQHYPAQHGVAAKMQALGCREVRIVRLLGGVMTINYGTKP